MTEPTQDQHVSREEFELVVRVLMLKIQTLTEMIALCAVKLPITQAQVDNEILARSQRTGTSAKMKEAVAALHKFESVRDILKDFEGPLQ